MCSRPRRSQSLRGRHPLADRGFYNGRIPRRSREISATAVPVQKKNKRRRKKTGYALLVHDDLSDVQSRERELRSPLAVAVSYHAGDYGKSGEIVRLVSACDRPDRTPNNLERLYQKRSAIETIYRVFRQTRGGNDGTKPIHSLCVRSGWIPVREPLALLRWMVVARLRRRRRDLPEEFTFKTSSDWIRYALEEELNRKWEIKVNGVGVPETCASAAS